MLNSDWKPTRGLPSNPISKLMSKLMSKQLPQLISNFFYVAAAASQNNDITDDNLFMGNHSYLKAIYQCNMWWLHLFQKWNLSFGSLSINFNKLSFKVSHQLWTMSFCTANKASYRTLGSSWDRCCMTSCFPPSCSITLEIIRGTLSNICNILKVINSLFPILLWINDRSVPLKASFFQFGA